MPLLLRIELGIFVLFFMFLLIKIISIGVLKLNYALVWFFACIVMAFAVIFPNLLDKISLMLRIKYTSNMIFLMAFILLFLIIFSLTLIISKQSIKITKIIQLVSIDLYERNDLK